ncbi:MAG: hypothetical protein GXP38_17480 [Chloroflexi bacterium]|nr:hypothetical protein [Chloroflexota bacterium]
MFLGIGYLPHRTGPAIWRDFDLAEIQDDLAHIAALGFQAVRVPLFWHDFQPSVDRISPKALDHFGLFLQAAADNALEVNAGLWTGIWDGALWWPEWGVNPTPLPPHWALLVNGQWARWGRIRHPFNDERMLTARTLLMRELVGYYAQHPAFFQIEPMPGFGRLAAAVDRGRVIDWIGDTVTQLQQFAPKCDCIFLQAFDALEMSTSVWPSDILEAGGQPALSIATFASDRRRLPLNARWIAFALDLATTLADQPLPLYLAGLPTSAPGEASRARDGVFYANEEEAAEHLAEVIAIARSRQCPALWLWRWADIPEERWNIPPYDRPNWRRHTGLLRADGSEKKLVTALSASTATRSYPHLEFDPEAYRADPRRTLSALWYEYQEAVKGV